MTSIANLLGVQWSGANEASGYSLHPHAAKQANIKGFAHSDVLAAANDPHHTYPNGRYEGQMRHIRNGIVAVVDPSRQQVVTVYQDQKETAPRVDQTDSDARMYATNWLRNHSRA